MRKPIFYSIDIVGRCNLACPSCPQGNSPIRLDKSFMPPHMLNQILLKAEKESVVMGVGLFNWGEPFTHPNLPEMINVVNRHKHACYLSTNLNTNKNLYEVLRAEPYSLRISCSGFTQPVYSKTHKQGDIETVKENMLFVSQFKSPKTKVHVLWHKYLHNRFELHDMKEYVERLGFQFVPIEAYYMPLETVLDVWDSIQPPPSIDENLLTTLYQHKHLVEKRKMRCRNLDFEVTIDSGGQVQLCCGVYDSSKFTISNFLSTSLVDIQTNRSNHSFCARCISNGGHIYVSGHSHSTESFTRKSLKAVARNVAPLIPKQLFKFSSL